MAQRRAEDNQKAWSAFKGTSSSRIPGRQRICKLVICKLAFAVAWSAAYSSTTSTALEVVAVDRDGVVVTVQGKIIVEAQDGGMILKDRQGKLWPLQPDEIKSRSQNDIPFTLMDQTELGKAILKELPPGFSTHRTKHFLICYNTSKAYAQWCGGLFERLFRAYNNFWGRRGMDLSDPEMPLVALIFKDKQSYRRYAVNELGSAVDSIDGYYNVVTNRIAMYDLTATPQVFDRPIPLRKPSDINKLLSQPMAGKLVATVIHEATHQLAFNCDVQQRYSDVDVWLNEGLAMYFETPDLSSKKGWRGMGEINLNRLATFRNYLKRRPDDSLYSLVANADRMQGRSDDSRFHGPSATLDAYSEAWALTYFLLTYEQEAFLDYLKFLSEKKPGRTETSEKKIKDFENFFGDLKSLDARFIQRMQKEMKRKARNLSRQP